MEKISRQKGITLLELMVVIAILAILAGIGVPNYLKYVPNWRVKNAATDLYGNLQLARATAIKERNACTVTFSGNPDQYTIGCSNKTVSLSDYKSGVAFENLAVNEMTFQANGIVDHNPDNAQELKLTNSGQTRKYTVRTFITGAIEIERD